MPSSHCLCPPLCQRSSHKLVMPSNPTYIFLINTWLHYLSVHTGSCRSEISHDQTSWKYGIRDILSQAHCKEIWIGIWEILTSHNIIRLPNYIKGVFTFAVISYPVDETFSNLTWRLFSIWTIYDYRWVEIAYNIGISDFACLNQIRL